LWALFATFPSPLRENFQKRRIFFSFVARALAFWTVVVCVVVVIIVPS